jgi:hypothetical protein
VKKIMFCNVINCYMFNTSPSSHTLETNFLTSAGSTIDDVSRSWAADKRVYAQLQGSGCGCKSLGAGARVWVRLQESGCGCKSLGAVARVWVRLQESGCGCKSLGAVARVWLKLQKSGPHSRSFLIPAFLQRQPKSHQMRSQVRFE